MEDYAEAVQAKIENRALKTNLYAHSANAHGDRQLLVDHLRNVAQLARDMASPFGGGCLAFLAGLWHDVGKADPKWQRYLRESAAGMRARGTGPDHKCAGAILAKEAGQDMAGFLIQAHHGGLQNREKFVNWLANKSQLDGPHDAIAALRRARFDLHGYEPSDFPSHAKEDALGAEFFLRLVYSALVDADSLDTEAHGLGGELSERGSTATLADLWNRYETFLASQPPIADSRVNRVRDEVHDMCCRAAHQPRGVFRLTVPTGGGKTRSAMAFAIRHGIKHDLRRVIVAVPFTTITQQTAHVYRDIFENGYSDTARIVLEHHSAAAEGFGKAPDDEDSFAPDAVWQRLAAENWDAPIVVTTTVQLFESLFSNRRGKTRKLHNLAESVILLDEAQALPTGLLSPILDGLRQLTENYGASVVLSTATQPAFECIKEFRKVTAHEIIPESAYVRHFETLRRVKYKWETDEPHQWREVAEWMREERSALAVVNTKRHAMELLDALNDSAALHLSTLLCGAHRTDVIREIKGRLELGEPCRVVATQVVEAGVDLDFASVFRAEGPLDAIIQAAGRCNREGLEDLGQVVVFRPDVSDHELPPGVYRSGRDIVRAMQNEPGFVLDKPATVQCYFKRLSKVAVIPDEKGIQRLRRTLDFPSVADKFRMIPDDSYDVVVDYPAPNARRIESLVEQLRARERPPRDIMRELQPYTVSLHRGEAELLQARGFIDDIPGLPSVGRWNGAYDNLRGITVEDPERIV